MQTVYTVALVLGLETVVDASYSLIFSPSSELSVSSRGYLFLILLSIVLLSIRFFWVPRNLNSFVLSFYDQLGEGVFTRVTMIHFPIALAHAVLFYYVCQVFVDLTQTNAGLESGAVHEYFSQFVGLFAGLLLLNALWLFWITPRGERSGRPGTIWAYNNVLFATVAAGVFAAFQAFDLSNVLFIVLTCGLFIVNSVIDLGKASKFYIVYDDPRSR